MQKYLSLIRREPRFRLLWMAQVVSLTGDWFNTLATVILINRYIGSELAIGLLFLSRALPVFIVSPIAGVIADRYNRQWIIILSNALRAVVVLGFLLVDSASTAWLVFALSVVQFSLSAFFEPAYNAIIPNLVSRDDLMTANTLNNVTWSAMLTLGALIGGIVTNIFGVQVALIIDSLTFLAAAGLVFAIPLSTEAATPDADEAEGQNRWRDLVDGYNYVRQHPDITAVALVKGLGQFGSVDFAIAIYADQLFKVGSEGSTTLGVLFAAHGLGAIVGPLVGDWLGKGQESDLRRWIGIGFGLSIIGWVIYALGGSLAIVTVGMVVRGMGGSINWTYSSILLQMRVPDKFLGRVFGLDFTFFTLMLSLGVFLPGVAMELWAISPRQMILMFAALTLISLAIWLGDIRRLANRQPAPAVGD